MSHATLQRQGWGHLPSSFSKRFMGEVTWVITAILFVWKAVHPAAPVAHCPHFLEDFAQKSHFQWVPGGTGLESHAVVRSHRWLCFHSSLQNHLASLAPTDTVSHPRKCFRKPSSWRGICWWGNSVRCIHLFHHNSRGESLDNHIIAVHSDGSCLTHHSTPVPEPPTSVNTCEGLQCGCWCVAAAWPYQCPDIKLWSIFITKCFYSRMFYSSLLSPFLHQREGLI